MGIGNDFRNVVTTERRDHAGPLISPTYKKYFLYTLHFERKLGAVQHYTGITSKDKLLTRMRSHARGSGSSLTRAAVKENIGLWLVSLHDADGFDDERILKKKGRAFRRCCICSPNIQRAEGLPHLLDPQLIEAPKPRPVLVWPEPKRER